MAGDEMAGRQGQVFGNQEDAGGSFDAVAAFNGVDDYILIPSESDLMSQGGSLSAWFSAFAAGTRRSGRSRRSGHFHRRGWRRQHRWRLEVAMVGAYVIFHMCAKAEWRAAETAGVYEGSSQDVADGFIHFSTAGQVAVSAAKHRAGQDGLVLLIVDAGLLGEALKWEQSRDGALFPHLHGRLPLAAVVRVDDLALGPDGRHAFPADVALTEAGA
jgi:uncharacterized protein (DUF952 family)